jgi:hypothetical protein
MPGIVNGEEMLDDKGVPRLWSRTTFQKNLSKMNSVKLTRIHFDLRWLGRSNANEIMVARKRVEAGESRTDEDDGSTASSEDCDGARFGGDGRKRALVGDGSFGLSLHEY